MPAECLPQVQACAIRVAKLYPNGVPRPGANTLYVSNALATADFSWETETGDQIREKNACGSVLVDYKAPDDLIRGNVEINLILPDPQLAEMLSTGSVLTVGSGATSRIGYAAPPLGTLTEDPVSIEVWAKRIRDRKLDSTNPYAWWVYPYVVNLRPSDHSHGNTNLAAGFVGEAYENDNWANGPLNDWPSTSDSVYQWIPTSSIPTTVCGYLATAAT